MKLNDYSWEIINDNVSWDDINRFEKQNKIELPDDYINAVFQYNGGSPREAYFTYEDPMYGTVNTGFAMMLSYCEEDDDNIFDILSWVGDQLPSGVYPIIGDGGGDYVCFDYRSSEKSPKIVYWCHELAGEKSIVPLEETFSSFVQKKLLKR